MFPSRKVVSSTNVGYGNLALWPDDYRWLHMQAQTDQQLPLSIWLAHQTSRLTSWGMPSHERNSYLAETLADWSEMQADRGSVSVFFRAIKGIPAGIWARFDEHDTTALPASLAIAFVGICGLVAGLLEAAYPVHMRRFVLLAALGTFLLGANLLRDPRRLILRRYRIPGLMLATGFGGMAANMPTQADWPYDAPFVDTPLADLGIVVGFVLVGLGFAAMVLASFAKRPQRLTMVAAITVMAGTALFATAQIAWGVVAVAIDPAITVTSVGIGLAALSFLHVVPRLRHLEIVRDDGATQ